MIRCFAVCFYPYSVWHSFSHVCYPYRTFPLSVRLACQLSTMPVAVMLDMLLSDGSSPRTYLLLRQDWCSCCALDVYRRSISSFPDGTTPFALSRVKSAICPRDKSWTTDITLETRGQVSRVTECRSNLLVCRAPFDSSVVHNPWLCVIT